MVEELQNVARLLLAPDRAAMQACERTLATLASRMERCGVPAFDRPHVARLLRNIRFLLDAANAFWQARQRAIAPALQYSSTGWLTSLGVNSTLNLEA